MLINFKYLNFNLKKNKHDLIFSTSLAKFTFEFKHRMADLPHFSYCFRVCVQIFAGHAILCAAVVLCVSRLPLLPQLVQQSLLRIFPQLSKINSLRFPSCSIMQVLSKHISVIELSAVPEFKFFHRTTQLYITVSCVVQLDLQLLFP